MTSTSSTDYRKYWAVQTGQPESSIYTPEALRGDEMTPTNPDNPTAEFKLTFEEGETKVLMEFHFEDNAEELLNPTEFVAFAANRVLSGLV